MTEDQFVEKSYSIEILDQIKSASPGLHQTTLDVLADMYGPGELYGTESNGPISINKIDRISIEQGAMMNDIMRSHSVERSLEVGFGYGFSTVWMLDALPSRSNSLHIAIDPLEKTWYHGIGLAQVERLAFEVRFEWIKNLSIHSLSDFIRQGKKFDFVFIDGNHRFDEVIVDFYLADKVVRTGGLIVLDDMWMNSVRTATNFIVNNRSYELVLQPVDNMAVLRKKRDDDRDWRHFKSFEVLGSSEISEPPEPAWSTISNGVMRLRRALREII